MSTTSELPADPDTTAEHPLPEPAAGALTGVVTWLGRNKVPVLVAAVVVALAGGSAAWLGTRTTPPTPSTPIELPSSMAGLSTLAKDPLRGTAWQQKAGQSVGSVAWSAKSYGSGGTGKSIRVVAARTDLTGKLEQAWAVGTGDQIGAVSCTHNTRLTPTSSAHERPTVLICWRTTTNLSAYALVIDPKAKTPVPNAEGAAAVDAAWRAAGGSD